MKRQESVTLVGWEKHKVITKNCRDGVTRYFCDCKKVFEDPQDAYEHRLEMRKHESTQTMASEEEDGESQEGGSPLRDS